MTPQERSLTEMRLQLHHHSLQRRLSPAAMHRARHAALVLRARWSTFFPKADDSARARGLVEALRFADPLAGIDWANADIEDLLTLVLMMGYAVEHQELEDMLKLMAEANKRKEQLRALATPGKHGTRASKHRPPWA
jgi:hypothetical protein